MNTIRKGKLTLIVLSSLLGYAAHAQKPAATPPAKTEEMPGIVWKKQIARVIDMGEKTGGSNNKNVSDVSSDNTMMDMFVNLIKSNKIIAYTTADHNFSTRLTVAELNKMLAGKKDTVLTVDAKGKTVSKIITHELNLDSIHIFRILEEWTCYPGTGKTEIQIIGLAPLREMYNDDGTYRNTQPMFWLRFADISAILARYQQYHPNNTLAGKIWDDYFSSQGAVHK